MKKSTRMDKIKKGLDALTKELRKETAHNTAKDDFPEIERTYTYRKTTKIKANDIG